MGESVLVEIKDEKTRTFQVMLLDNDTNNQVEVHEEAEISFSRIQEHLQRGGSVFITSKPSQKMELSTMTGKVQRRRATKTVTAFYFDHV